MHVEVSFLYFARTPPAHSLRSAGKKKKFTLCYLPSLWFYGHTHGCFIISCSCSTILIFVVTSYLFLYYIVDFALKRMLGQLVPKDAQYAETHAWAILSRKMRNIRYFSNLLYNMISLIIFSRDQILGWKYMGMRSTYNNLFDIMFIMPVNRLYPGKNGWKLTIFYARSFFGKDF